MTLDQARIHCGHSAAYTSPARPCGSRHIDELGYIVGIDYRLRLVHVIYDGDTDPIPTHPDNLRLAGAFDDN